MPDFTGTAFAGLQFLGQASPGEKYGYLTIGTQPIGFDLNKAAFFYSEMQFTSLVGVRDAVFDQGKSIYRAGAVLIEPELPAGAFLFYFANWRVGGLPWRLTTF